MKSDKELQRNVVEALAWEPRVDAAHIGVSVENGIVILNGHAKTLNEKWTAQRVAQRVQGVRAVTDEVAIKVPTNTQSSDADIAQAAVSVLDWNSLVPPNRIKVLVEHGQVTLEGAVEHHFQKEAAETAVRHLKGVKGILNAISIEPRPSAGDVIHGIKKALHRAAQVDAERISVEARDGKIILSGNVRSWVEREEAEYAAWAAPGVSHVQNDIRIVSSIAA